MVRESWTSDRRTESATNPESENGHRSPKGAAHQKGGANKGDQVNILGLGGSGRATCLHRPKNLSESALNVFEGGRPKGTFPC